jgi:sortase A
MPPIVRQRKRPFLRWAHGLLLALGVGLLGYVGYSQVDAKLYQAYENWRFNQAVMSSHPSAAAAQPKVVRVSSLAPDEVSLVPVVRGAVLGRLEISRIGVSVIIAEGTDGRILRRAVGHIPGTALPGEQGNIAISGHRDTFFRALKDIQRNDEVTLTTLNGSYRYRVDTMKVVAEDDVAVLDNSGESVLTLVTCYPFYYVGPAPKRFVVRAHRI